MTANHSSGEAPGRARPVAAIIPATRTLEGEGFPVRRPFPTVREDQFDPFLLLDEMGPMDVAPGEAKGAPDHPHRGFETVTYLLSGEFEHRDSAGHSGRLQSGDVQWMTAGAGVVHSEMPSAALSQRGGRLHGFQIWVNLPRARKMTPPRYQGVDGHQFPTPETPDGQVRVRVIAGEALGESSPVETHTPIFYLHLSMKPGARFTYPTAPDFNVMAYVFQGGGTFGEAEQRANDGYLVRYGPGDSITLQAGEERMEALLLGGRPIGEPVVRYGPFVMNTAEEINQAIRDFQSGRMGKITA